MGAPKQKWTPEEEAALRAGIEKHGAGKWRTIQKDPEFCPYLSTRSNIDLKDKWRNMSVSAGGQGSREKLRTPKLKCLPSIPLPNSEIPASSAQLKQDRSEAVKDSSRSLQDGNSTPRYASMIIEALSTIREPSGVEIGAICNFIEQKYEVAPNFRRLLSTKLRRLVGQNKIEKQPTELLENLSQESTKRDPSTFELVEGANEQRESEGKKIKSRRKQLKKPKFTWEATTRRIPYARSFPIELIPYIQNIKDVKADGNCGFRTVAIQLGFVEEDWSTVRKDLIKELEDHIPLYVCVLGSEDRIWDIKQNLSWDKSDTTAPFQHWMDMPETVSSKWTRYKADIASGWETPYLPQMEKFRAIFPLRDPEKIVVD